MAIFKIGDRVRTKERNMPSEGTVRKVLPRKGAVEVTWDHRSHWLRVEQPFAKIEHISSVPYTDAQREAYRAMMGMDNE